jgi:Bacterial TSP3 repeat
LSVGLLAGLAICGSFLGASLFCAPLAVAKEAYPGDIARHLGAQSKPPCGLCHEYGKTGTGATVVTPFGWAIRARGFTDASSLTAALDRVATDKVDSDGDGAFDTEEIIAGTDPNSPASTPGHPGATGDPQLGCAVAGDARGAWTSLAAILLALGFGARRRGLNRRPRRSSPSSA